MVPFGADPVPPYISLPLAVLMMVAMWWVGYRVLPGRHRPHRAVLAAPLCLSVGMTVIGVVTWTVGALIGTTVALWSAALLAAAGATAVRPWWTDVRRLVVRLWTILIHEPLLALLTFASAGIGVIQLLMPVVDSDGLRYHLALAKLYLLEGRVFFYPWDVHAAFPQSVEAVYMLGLRMAGGEVAKFLHFGAFLASLAVLVLFVHRNRASRRAAVCAAWFFAASPAVVSIVGAAFIDLVVIFHLGVAALLARNRARPVLIGLALAGASACKWSVGPAVAGLVLLVWWRHRFGLRTLAALVLPIVVMLTPFMVRNAVATGDPFFPMGIGLVGGHVPGVDEDRHAYVTQRHREIPGPLGVPWGRSVGEVQGDEVAGWHLLLGLLALPLAVRRPGGAEVLAIAVPYLAVGLAFHPSTRLAMPLLWALAVASAAVVSRVAGRFTPAVGAILLAPAALTAWTVATSHGQPIDFLRGELTAEEAIRSAVPGREAAVLVNGQPAGGRVMALDFPAPYFFDRPWIAEGINNQPPLYEWLAAGDEADAILDRLEQLAVRYLVITPGYGGGTPISLIAVGETPHQRRVMAQLRKRLELIGTTENVDVYLIP